MALVSLTSAPFCYSHVTGFHNGGFGSLDLSLLSSATSSPSTSSYFSFSSFSSRHLSNPIFGSCCRSTRIFDSWVVTSLKLQGLRVEVMGTSNEPISSPKNILNVEYGPDHLLVLVHGLVASPSDWTFIGAELRRRLGKNFLIYASSSNAYTRTLAGIDVAGKRLADEVKQVVQTKTSLKRISFLAHSLGGLFARYAIATLYSPDFSEDSNHLDSSDVQWKGTIAGLEPVNFISLATPHLGVRGRKQLPFLFGVPILEKLALPLASIVAGRSGSQLFVTDGRPDKPPLLLRMASDVEEAKFISALGAFRCRLIYANVSYDHMVGWRTSSIRRETELIKPPLRSLDRYDHVVNVEDCPPVSLEGPRFTEEAAMAKAAAQGLPTVKKTADYHEMMEEEMIRGLQQLSWTKVDVSFHSAPFPFLAHNNIHVKSEWLNGCGVGVVAHVADSLRKQENTPPIIAASSL